MIAKVINELNLIFMTMSLLIQTGFILSSSLNL